MANLPFLAPTTVDQAIASLLKTIKNLENVLKTVLSRAEEDRLAAVELTVSYNANLKEADRAEAILNKLNDLIGE